MKSISNFSFHEICGDELRNTTYRVNVLLPNETFNVTIYIQFNTLFFQHSIQIIKKKL